MQEIDQHVGSTVRWNLTKRIKIFNKYLQHSQIAKCNHLICRRHVTSSSYLKNFVSSMIFIVVKYLQNSQSFGNHRVENTIQIPSVNRRVEKLQRSANQSTAASHEITFLFFLTHRDNE